MRGSVVVTTAAIAIAGLVASFPGDGYGRAQQSGDTLRVAVGSDLMTSGATIPVHGSKIDRLIIEPGKEPRKAGWITNVMTIGDTAGRPVFRFVTEGEQPAANGGTNRYTLYTTFDQKTSAILGYNISGSLGNEVRVSFDGNRVRGMRKPGKDAVVQLIDRTLSRPGFLGSAMDIPLALLPLRPGLVIEMPVWMPNLTDVESRWYVVKSKGTAKMGGKTIDAWVTEEWNADWSKMLSVMNVIRIAPFMEWQEFEPPSGGKLRLVQELM